MATKLCYRDLSHPSFQETIKGHNFTTLKLVKTVAEFAQKISLAHEQFANQVLNVVESYKKKYQELRKEREATATKEEDDRQSMRSSRASLRSRRRSSRKSRPVDCASSLNNAWETLLQETQYDAQAHADTATLIMKNVYTPLLEVASYKKSQAKKLYQFRENFDSILNNAEENVYKCHKAYIEAYQNYRKNSNGRDSMMYMAQYHNAHNEYVLQIRASNDQQHEYHNEALPYLLEELEEIHIDLANTLNGAIESHALLLLTKVNANEQSRRFEGILKICKQVNPKLDIHNFILSVSQEPVPFEPKLFSFQPPSDPNIPGSELGTLKEQIVFDRSTEPAIKARRLELQKEASELTSYLKQNQDITHTLMNVCQRNLANHLYAKVYETQEDLCRKRNEIRIANLQLAAIRAQIELLSPKQNGSTVDGGDGAHSSNKQSIKGMWKKAFRSLKVKDKEKDTAKAANEETSSRYSRQLRQQHPVTEDMSSRQSSLKRVLRRKVSEEVSDPEPVPEEDPRNMDPVFAHLKQAADARKRCLSTGSSFDASMDEVGLGLDTIKK